MFKKNENSNIFVEEAKKAEFSYSLHAMRGIAALVVFFFHIKTQALSGIGVNPVNGFVAVTFFYILSGLVVGISIAKHKISWSSYFDYGVRRFFRMMPLMFVTVTIGGIYLLWIDPHMPEKFLPEDYGDFSFLKWLSAYIGYSLKPNPPIWSIFVEIVASVLLPIWILMSVNRICAAFIFLSLLVFGCLNLDFQHHWNFYMVNFYLGLSVLLWGPKFADLVRKMNGWIFWAFVSILMLAFYLPRILYHYEYGEYWFNLVELLPIAALIALAYYIPEKFKWLETKPFKFLGDISFSLYLVHSLQLIIVHNILLLSIPADYQSMWIVGSLTCLIVIPLSLLTAAWSYKNIELRFIGYGKGVAKFYRKRFTNQ